MAASYWESHCSRNLVSKEQLENTHAEDRLLGLTREHIQQLNYYFCASISELAKHCKLRQRVAASAMVYFRRTYLCNNFCRMDPRLVSVACLYLACKAEEALLAAKHVVMCAKSLRPKWTYDVKDLLDMEMVLLEDLDFNLVVFSPYRDLALFLADCRAEQQLGQRAWGALNDSYRTDVNLLHPPHVVALGCMCLAAASCGHDLAPWLRGLAVDLAQVAAVVSEMSAVYALQSSMMSPEECHRLLDMITSRWDSSSATAAATVANAVSPVAGGAATAPGQGATAPTVPPLPPPPPGPAALMDHRRR